MKNSVDEIKDCAVSNGFNVIYSIYVTSALRYNGEYVRSSAAFRPCKVTLRLVY